MKASKPSYVSQTFAPVIVLANEVVEVPKLDLEVQKGDVAGVVQVETFLGAMGDSGVDGGVSDLRVQVSFLSLNLQAIVGPGEAFTLEGVALGHKTLRFEVLSPHADLYAPVERSVEVTAGLSSVPQVYMPLLRGSIAGSVVDESTLPLAGGLSDG